MGTGFGGGFSIDLGKWGKVFEIVSAITEATGQIYGGISESQAAEENRKRSEALAAAATERATYEAELKRREGRRLKGTQTARYAASGVQMGGSPLAVMAQTMADIEKDAMMIEKGGRVEAGGYRHEAQLYKMQGQQSLWGGIIKGGSSLLTSAAGWLRPKEKTTNSPSGWAKYNFPKTWI